jgi:hypothetical protein
MPDLPVPELLTGHEMLACCCSSTDTNVTPPAILAAAATIVMLEHTAQAAGEARIAQGRMAILCGRDSNWL